ncbi:N-acetylneuraminate synthase family protein [Candidatus Uhrbacteria bacterium]|nr:N-acetylneuraminate synthase family protein [Candidatus Uhrbacteria bacterium]
MTITLLDSNKFDFNDLFIFEMANNHQGDLEHGKRIVRDVAAVAKKHGVKAGVKLQFRDLDTFVHPDSRADTQNKHIPRFLSTRLSTEQFAELVTEIKTQGLISICTPFDEPSVDQLKKLGVEVLKIGSCSAKDWPLLDKAAKARLPMIVSTGGLTTEDTDKLAFFLEHRYAHFALMHCVAIYPTPPSDLQLSQISRMKRRYPDVTVGFSTHERPDNVTAIQMAYALGARIFEKHVGVETEQYKLNAYSATPEQVDRWIAAYQEAVASYGPKTQRAIDPKEIGDLLSLQRGIFAKVQLKEGEEITSDEIFFAFPIREGQLPSGRWRTGLRANRNYAPNEPLDMAVRPPGYSTKEHVHRAVWMLRGMLNEAGITLNPESDFEVELSHHYGIERFREIGVTIVTVINREYCKKLLVVFPGQQHPYHHHIRKEETFHVLSGDFWSELEGRKRLIYPGDVLVVPRGVKHRFWSEGGAIVEEVSTTHYNNDSVYEDPRIANTPREHRKTKLDGWGRHFDFDD